MAPRMRARGLADLGRVIDARSQQPTNKLVYQQGLGSATAVPLSGTCAGGGSASVASEQTVSSLQTSGAEATLSGDLVLAVSGELSLAQSADAPHFTFASPEYTAGDGLSRSGAQFSCDGTVLRTTGNQAVGGVKTFTDFPLTPTALPEADYEAANKLYVDEQASAVALHYPGALFCPQSLAVPDADGASAARSFHTTAWPASASFAAINAAPALAMDLDAINLGDCCATFNWISQPDGADGISSGAAVGLGIAYAKAAHRDGARSGKATVRARVRVNSLVRLSRLELALNDVGVADATPAHSVHGDVLAALADDAWGEVVLAATGTDISAWSNQLRVGLIAYGTEEGSNAGITQFSLDWIRVELWRD